MFNYISVHNENTCKGFLGNQPGASCNGGASDEILEINEMVYQTYREVVDPYVSGIDKLAWSLLTMHLDSTVR